MKIMEFKLGGYRLLEKFRKKKQYDFEVTQEEAKVEELKIEAENMEEEAIQKHEKHYSDEGLWNKVQRFSKKAGSTVVYAV